MHYLVTGAAGFIGFHVSLRLLAAGHRVTGIDNLNDYYEVSLKEARLAQLQQQAEFHWVQGDIADRTLMSELFSGESFDRVIHLAAQAGVRYSLENPFAYSESNLTGFLTILEGCRQQKVPHLIYASSSSVYGLNEKSPFHCADRVDHPVSLYAATKKANELMAHSYAHLYDLPVTGLRFFTVYGPWGRPDMALFKFTKAILNGQPIDVYNQGALRRDFTYIDDIVEGILRVSDKSPERKVERQNDSETTAPYQVYNIGRGESVALLDFIDAIEVATGKPAQKNMLPMQPGDVVATWADCEDLYSAIDYRPKTSVREGVANFVEWYRNYYGI